MKAKLCLLVVLWSLFPLMAENYYVEVYGKDSEDRDGKTKETAWASLSYACEKVQAGDHTFNIGPGKYTIVKTAHLKNGFKIKGSGSKGDNATVFTASTGWKMVKKTNEKDPLDEYMIASFDKNDLSVSNIAFRSEPSHRLTGAVRLRGGKNHKAFNLDIREFKWCGINLEYSSNVKLFDSVFHNASMSHIGMWNGAVRSRWIAKSEIYNNKITSDKKSGYGYKASGHDGVKIYNNYIDVKSEFSLESAHENEYGVEIYNNHFTGCMSIPKGGQGDDPNNRGYKYSFWIHHNLLNDSYTIEGPRNHLLFEYNYVNITKPGGRVYTHHGGSIKGPVWIQNNVVVNVDLGFVWMNQGYMANIFVRNNTVFLGKRGGAVFDSYTKDRLDNWVIENNIIIGDSENPRMLFPTHNGVPTKISAKNNIFVNLSNPPEGNFTGVNLEFLKKGPKPWSYFSLSKSSFGIKKGELLIDGKTKKVDIGAV